MEYNGILIIDKKEGIGSTDVVRIIKKKLQQSSVGHTGTLDFLSTGVLVVCLGKATKLIEYMQLQKKTYKAGIIFGLETDTYDIEGTVINNLKSNISEDNLKVAIDSFIGDIQQVPPMYSALKVDGERLYNLARKGITIERKSRLVNIESISIDKFDDLNQLASITATVGAGTYIRSLIYDIGISLETYGTMSSLRRLKCSGYDIGDAISIDWDSDPSFIKENIIPIESVELPMADLTVDEDEQKRLLNGMTVILSQDVDLGLYKIFCENTIIGIGKITKSEKGTLLKLSKHLK